MTTQQQIDDFHEACALIESFTHKVTRPDFKHGQPATLGSCHLFSQHIQNESHFVKLMALQLFETAMQRWCDQYGSGRPAYPVPAPGYELGADWKSAGYKKAQAKAFFAFYNWPLWPADSPATPEQVNYVMQRQHMLGYIRVSAATMAYLLPKNFLVLKEKFKAKLAKVKDSEELQREYPRKGICNLMLDFEDDAGAFDAMLNSLFCDWPKYSGDPMFPVPGSDGLSPAKAFEDAARKNNLWTGAYGKLRKELCQWCIDNVDNLISLREPGKIKALFADVYGT